MPKRTDISRTLILSFLFFAVLMSQAFACTYFPPTYTVGKNFAVRVSSLEGATYPGVRVILVRAHRVSKSALTDEKGRVHFENVEPGDYSLEIDQLGIAGWDTSGLKVVDSPDKQALDKQEIQLHWPSSEVLQAAELKGIFLASGTAKPIATTSLQLVHGLNGSLESRLLTDETGRFDLGSPEPGFYFIKVEPALSGPWEPRGTIPVVVKPGSVRELVVALAESSCGLEYSEVCGAPAVTVSRIEGNVTDSQGAAIGRANIELFQSKSKDQAAVKSVAPNNNGHFTIADVAPGDYQLRISSTGFAPLFISITVAPNASIDRPLNLKLGVLGGACPGSKAAQQENISY
jgi:Carboxypeptidase regulatory-like domain